MALPRFLLYFDAFFSLNFTPMLAPQPLVFLNVLPYVLNTPVKWVISLLHRCAIIDMIKNFRYKIKIPLFATSPILHKILSFVNCIKISIKDAGITVITPVSEDLQPPIRNFGKDHFGEGLYNDSEYVGVMIMCQRSFG
jgi:hypothetical protein